YRAPDLVMQIRATVQGQHIAVEQGPQADPAASLRAPPARRCLMAGRERDGLRTLYAPSTSQQRRQRRLGLLEIEWRVATAAAQSRAQCRLVIHPRRGQRPGRAARA